jgi:hypothetical protein
MSIYHGQIDEIRPPSLMFASCPTYSNMLMVRENRCNGGLRGLPHVAPRAHDHVGAMVRHTGGGSRLEKEWSSKRHMDLVWGWMRGGSLSKL